MSQQDAANSSFAFHPESLNKTASLKQLVDFLPLGAMLVCSDARILLANDLLNEILGYESDELVDEDVGVILPSDYQENHAAYIKSFFQNPHKRTMGEGETFHVKCKSGRLLPIEMGMNPLVSEDSPMVLVTLVDFSPKRRATTMFQRSIQVAPHGVLVVDSNGIIQLANSMLTACFANILVINLMRSSSNRSTCFYLNATVNIIPICASHSTPTPCLERWALAET